MAEEQGKSIRKVVENSSGKTVFTVAVEKGDREMALKVIEDCDYATRKLFLLAESSGCLNRQKMRTGYTCPHFCWLKQHDLKVRPLPAQFSILESHHCPAVRFQCMKSHSVCRKCQGLSYPDLRQSYSRLPKS